MTPQENALMLVQGATEFVKGDKDHQIQTVGEIVDLLIGTDQTALVTNIAFLDAGKVEMITDFMKQEIMKRLSPPPATT